jgi:hypothetical protein
MSGIPIKARLDVVLEADGEGEPVTLASVVNKCVQISGSFVATLEIQMRADEAADWVTVATTSSTGIVELWESLPMIRVLTSAYTSGEPNVWLTGVEV